MLETVITIILIPVALAAIVVAAAMVVGVCKAIFKKKSL